MAKKINLPCDGNGGNKSIRKEADTITFETSGSCMFTGFNFTGVSGSPYYPPGFSNKTPSNGVGASVSYSYDGFLTKAALEAMRRAWRVSHGYFCALEFRAHEGGTR